MTKKEGTIKYKFDFTQTAPLSSEQVAELNAWRKVMYLLQLIGQSPDRYAGYGFGNISQRLSAPGDQLQFVITGTQTGFLADLTAEHYTTVLECYPEQNRLVSAGPVKPSAESMTHGAVYAMDDSACGVIHAHSPHIWELAEQLGLPQTAPNVSYGTPEMSAEVVRLFAETPVRESGVFSMAGHEDGIVAFGPSVAEASARLIAVLARAFKMGAVG